MKFVLVILLLVTSAALAKDKAKPETHKVAPKARVSASNQKLAIILENHRKELAPNLDSSKQYKEFDAALGDLCSSLQSDEAEMGQAEYLKQMLLLTDRLLEIDTGKNAMDCFGGYHEGRHDMIKAALKTLEVGPRQRLLEEISLFQQAISSEGE